MRQSANRNAGHPGASRNERSQRRPIDATTKPYAVASCILVKANAHGGTDSSEGAR